MHALDPLIRELRSMSLFQLNRRDRATLDKAARMLCVLRDEIQLEHCDQDTGEISGDIGCVAEMLRNRINGSRGKETSRFGKPVLERLEEAREEGRKKELERVIGIIRSMGEQACVSMISPFRSDSYVERINERVEAFHQVLQNIAEDREGSAQGQLIIKRAREAARQEVDAHRAAGREVYGIRSSEVHEPTPDEIRAEGRQQVVQWLRTYCSERVDQDIREMLADEIEDAERNKYWG